MRFKKLRRFWSVMMDGSTGGLIQSGDWRVQYPDGNITHWMSYGDAFGYKDCFGGTLEWRYD